MVVVRPERSNSYDIIGIFYVGIAITERKKVWLEKNVLFGRLLMLVMVVLTGTSVCSAVSSDELEAMRQEIKELRQMVKGLTKEVSSFREAKGQESSQQAQYQRELDEIRADVTKLNESPMFDLADTLGKVKLGGYGEIHSNFTEGTESDKMAFHRLVLYLGYDFADWIKFHSETELEHAFTKDMRNMTHNTKCQLVLRKIRLKILTS